MAVVGMAFPARSVAVADGVQIMLAVPPTVVTGPEMGAPRVTVITPAACVMVEPLKDSVPVVKSVRTRVIVPKGSWVLPAEFQIWSRSRARVVHEAHLHGRGRAGPVREQREAVERVARRERGDIADLGTTRDAAARRDGADCRRGVVDRDAAARDGGVHRGIRRGHPEGLGAVAEGAGRQGRAAVVVGRAACGPASRCHRHGQLADRQVRHVRRHGRDSGRRRAHVGHARVHAVGGTRPDVAGGGEEGAVLADRDRGHVRAAEVRRRGDEVEAVARLPRKGSLRHPDRRRRRGDCGHGHEGGPLGPTRPGHRRPPPRCARSMSARARAGARALRPASARIGPSSARS